MEKRLRSRLPLLGLRRSSDVASLLLICTAGLLFIHSSHLRSSLDELVLTADSDPPALDVVLEAPQHLNRRLAPPLNRTGEAQQQDLLVFTKIPRCGGTAIGHVLHGLSGPRFSVWDEDPYKHKQLLPSSKAVALQAIAEMDKVPKPAAVIKEMSHLDFAKQGHKRPIYVSMIRDPLEHAHSQFYWLRAPFAVVERALTFGKDNAVNHLPRATFLKKNFEVCLTSNDPECTYRPGAKRSGHPMQAFCTKSPDCPTFGSRAALQEAKRAVEEEYAVVGLLEDWDTSLAVMERLVPRFFDGATAYSRERVALNRTLRNENFYKPKLRSAARQMMAKHFQTELEFYEFAKQRLYKQYEGLKG